MPLPGRRALAGVALLIGCVASGAQGSLTVDESLAVLQQRQAELRRQLDAQETRLAELAVDRARLQALQRDWRPLLTRWVDALQAHAEAGPPVQLDVRLASLAAARALLDDPESSAAASANAVLDVFRSEIELATGSGAYPGFAATDGEQRAVRYVYLGQLFFGWLSGDDGAFWRAGQWQPLDDALRQEVEALERIAAGRAPARRLVLPVPDAVDSP